MATVEQWTVRRHLSTTHTFEDEAVALRYAINEARVGHPVTVRTPGADEYTIIKRTLGESIHLVRSV